MSDIISAIAAAVWGDGMILLILGVGVFLTIKLGFFQLRLPTILRHTAAALFKKDSHRSRNGGISQFEALATTLSAAMGTGNIAGVATALAMGGAGAVFWMWVSALFGMIIVYAENYLGSLYRTRLRGEQVGGPMYYIEKGLCSKPLAAAFALFCVPVSLGMGNMAQSNTAAGSAAELGISPTLCSLMLIAAVLPVISGGLRRVGRAAAVVIPAATCLYAALALAVIIKNAAALPEAIRSIFRGAFGIPQAAGGAVGYSVKAALSAGVRRGIFSNEAGLGSSAIAHASADAPPHIQGMWGIFEVFADTIVCCSLTALAVLCSGAEGEGVYMVINAFESVLGGISGKAVAAAVAVFAYATIIGWSGYGQRAAEYLLGRRARGYPIAAAAAIFVGAQLEPQTVWNISDIFNGMMAAANLTAVILLSKRIKKPPG